MKILFMLFALVSTFALQVAHADDFLSVQNSERVRFSYAQHGDQFAALATLLDQNGRSLQDISMTDWTCDGCGVDPENGNGFRYSPRDIVSFCNEIAAKATQQGKKVAIGLKYANSPWVCAIASENRD